MILMCVCVCVWLEDFRIGQSTAAHHKVLTYHAAACSCDGSNVLHIALAASATTHPCLAELESRVLAYQR